LATLGRLQLDAAVTPTLSLKSIYRRRIMKCLAKEAEICACALIARI
jgi:hypothetical protein